MSSVAAVPDIDDVLAAAQARAAALVAGDAVALRSLLHPHVRWTTHRGDVLDREHYIAANTGGPLHWKGQSLEDVEVVVAGDSAVLVATVVDVVERDGATQTFRLRLTQTWVRADGRWQCLAGHAGPAVELS